MTESNFYKKIKKKWKSISLIRIENRALLGTPDLLCQNAKGTFFTLELKLTKVNSVALSPHQCAFHMKHKKNTFILVSSSLNPELVRLFPGSRILELVNLGINGAGPPLAEGLDACESVLVGL